MIIKDDRVFYTEQDKENVLIKQYTDEELNAKETLFKKKRNVRRIVFLILLFVAIILCVLVEALEYPLGITIFWLFFLIILYESIDRENLKVLRLYKYYFEVVIEEKLSAEVIIEQTLEYSLKHFYPIKGVVVGTNYRSVFFVDQDQYLEDVGTSIRISVQGEKL